MLKRTIVFVLLVLIDCRAVQVVKSQKQDIALDSARLAELHTMLDEHQEIAALCNKKADIALLHDHIAQLDVKRIYHETFFRKKIVPFLYIACGLGLMPLFLASSFCVCMVAGRVQKNGFRKMAFLIFKAMRQKNVPALVWIASPAMVLFFGLLVKRMFSAAFSSKGALKGIEAAILRDRLLIEKLEDKIAV